MTSPPTEKDEVEIYDFHKWGTPARMKLMRVTEAQFSPCSKCSVLSCHFAARHRQNTRRDHRRIVHSSRLISALGGEGAERREAGASDAAARVGFPGYWWRWGMKAGETPGGSGLVPGSTVQVMVRMRGGGIPAKTVVVVGFRLLPVNWCVESAMPPAAGQRAFSLSSLPPLSFSCPLRVERVH